MNDTCTYPVFGPSHKNGGVIFTDGYGHRYNLEGFEWIIRNEVLNEHIDIKDKTPAEALAQISEQTKGKCPGIPYSHINDRDFIVCKVAAENSKPVNFSGNVAAFLHEIQIKNGCKGFNMGKGKEIQELWYEMRNGGPADLPTLQQRADNCRQALCEAQLYTQLCTFNDLYAAAQNDSDALYELLAGYEGFNEAIIAELGGQVPEFDKGGEIRNSVLDELQNKTNLHEKNLWAEEKDTDIEVNDWIYERFSELADSKKGTIYNQEAIDYVKKSLPELNQTQENNLGTQIYYSQQKRRQERERVKYIKLKKEGWEKLVPSVVQIALDKDYLLRVLMSSEGVFGKSEKEAILKPFKDAEGNYYVMDLRATRKGYSIGVWRHREWFYKFVDKKSKKEIIRSGSDINKPTEGEGEKPKSILTQKTDLKGDEKQDHQRTLEEFTKKMRRGTKKYLDANPEKAKEWHNEQIQNALDKGWYQEDVYKGRMTASDAKTIIESGGLEVPKDILEMATKVTEPTEPAIPTKPESEPAPPPSEPPLSGSGNISHSISNFTLLLQGKPPTLPEHEAEFVQKVKEDALADIKYDKRHMTAIGEQHGITNLKLLQELTELAIVLSARELLTFQDSLGWHYPRVIRLYENQVNLAHRTSTTYLRQQYSTPAPIAYLAGSFLVNRHIRIIEPKYFEPSAGNGLLTIALGNPENVIVNEIDYIRRRHLWTQGFKEVLSRDASQPFTGYEKHFDGVITNPPFGSAEAVQYNGFQITGLEHLMALRTLDTMKDNGRAAIIIGGHTKYDKWGKIQEGKNRNFFIYLHRYYDVLDVINISGRKLYSRMGTGFDIRLILIDGRKHTEGNFPPLENKALKVEEPFSSQVVENWDDLFGRVTQHF